jgi:hypothetical protein
MWLSDKENKLLGIDGVPPKVEDVAHHCLLQLVLHGDRPLSSVHSILYEHDSSRSDFARRRNGEPT